LRKEPRAVAIDDIGKKPRRRVRCPRGSGWQARHGAPSGGCV